jgi:hypothetical protein
MRINEVTNHLKQFVATVSVNGISIKTSITAENSSYARLLLLKLYGTGNVSSLSESSSEIEESDATTKTLTPQQLQVKSLADKAKQINQQKKQLQARQALMKAQEKMRVAVKPVT